MDCSMRNGRHLFKCEGCGEAIGDPINIGEPVGPREPRVFLEWADGSYLSSGWTSSEFRKNLKELVALKGVPVKVEYREYCWS